MDVVVVVDGCCGGVVVVDGCCGGVVVVEVSWSFFVVVMKRFVSKWCFCC